MACPQWHCRAWVREWSSPVPAAGIWPPISGFADDQRWTPGRIKTLIGRLFHVGCAVEGTGKLMHRRGWSVQVPVRQAIERDDDAIAVWKSEVWPR